MGLTYFKEEWKQLVVKSLGPSEIYEISNYGRVKSYKKESEGRILKDAYLKGYAILTLTLKNGRRTTKYIHKLVAEHFIPKDNRLQSCVIHLDFDKSNNYVTNLLWVTKQTMFAHQRINPNYHRGMVSNSKLTETDVIRLKMKLKRGKNKPIMLAKEFGITHTQLNRIKRGENWGHIVV
jgi:hypothetical protein